MRVALRAKTLNIYVAREVLPTFILALFILTALLLLGRVMHYATLVLSRGVGALDILRLFSYLIPFILALTIPIALLLGVLFAFGRLSSENELTAMRASGVSLFQLLPAPLGLGVLSYILCALITFYLLPWGNTAFKDSLYHMLHSKAMSAIQEGVFDDEIEGVVLFVERIKREENTAEGVLIFDRRSSPFPVTITAREAHFPTADQVSALTTVGEGLTLELRDGSIHSLDGSLYRRIDFDVYRLTLPTAPHGTKGKDLYDMTLTELREEAKRLRARGELPWRPLVEFHERLAVPLACIVFAILGVPLGIRPPRSGKFANVSLGVAIVLIYYLCVSAGESLGRSGAVPPFLAIWSWNILLTGLGMYFLWRADTGRPVLPSLPLWTARR